jgi:lipopolysaccharide export system permease protein
MVVSIIMFILYYVINMIGIKMGREGVLSEWAGAWLASIILLPVGFFILNRAANESAIFDKDKYKKMIETVNKMFTRKIQKRPSNFTEV